WGTVVFAAKPDNEGAAGGLGYRPDRRVCRGRGRRAVSLQRQRVDSAGIEHVPGFARPNGAPGRQRLRGRGNGHHRQGEPMTETARTEQVTGCWNWLQVIRTPGMLI